MISTKIFTIKPIVNYTTRRSSEVMYDNWVDTQTYWAYSRYNLASHLSLKLNNKVNAKIGLTKEQCIALGLVTEKTIDKNKEDNIKNN